VSIRLGSLFLEFCRATTGGRLFFDLDVYRGLDFASRRLFLLRHKFFGGKQQRTSTIAGVDGKGRLAKAAERATTSRAGWNRPWLSVLWRCCDAYSRIYRNDDATAYEGGCPRCGRRVRIPIGPGGTDDRFFEAY
jgi:hypothetical protein